MSKVASGQAVESHRMLVMAIMPFALPILLTFALLLLVGNHWPRDIAPGSGLKLAGLCASAITSIALWQKAAAQTQSLPLRKGLAVFCAVTGLMGWPVWSVGILPSINGASISDQASVRMRLDRTETTHQSKSRKLYYWAWLEAYPATASPASGRYFIQKDVYDRFERTSPESVAVKVGRGLLGAQVVMGYE